eukprot:CAMPEP_0170547252 /NCGR_PEP_ID=MMETSP0211-20121228/5614_1 /TAXON_ID=311385 /ORGANISM="Pseudokeronopsis sp., Strain OXSARD2" /LENGTH=34 /DNA_ID= /DNA_START= /DNA_END= /DNA_ORIENTATION=
MSQTLQNLRLKLQEKEKNLYSAQAEVQRKEQEIK